MAAGSSTSNAAALRLEGKVALITGGASGIGKATVKLFAQHGARVVIADIQDDLGRTLCDEIRGPNSICSYIHCDVTDESDVKRAVDSAVEIYGKLDIMVNNAGICGSPEIRITESEKSNFELVMSVNLTGCYLGTKHAARVMIPARSGSIVSMASVALVDPSATPVAYTCSKHAVNMCLTVNMWELNPKCKHVNSQLITNLLGQKAT